jgi:hypothetical protein
MFVINVKEKNIIIFLIKQNFLLNNVLLIMNEGVSE